MNLGDLASYVGLKINQSEPDDLVAIKGFLKRRYEMIWNDQLWKDSVVEYTQTLTSTGYTIASNWLPTVGVLLLPPIIAKVMAVRTDTRKLNVQRPEIYYRQDYDTFAKTGMLSEYILLSPCVWQFQTAPVHIQVISDESDDGSIVSMDYLGTDNVSVSRETHTLVSDNDTLDNTTTRIDAFLKPISGGYMTITPDSVSLVAMAPTDTSAPKRQRIRLVQIPSDASFAIRVLAKRTCPTFTDDKDEPAISGIENCLLAFAQADALQRERQYGKSQAIAQEGIALLEQLKKQETVQQAYSVRFIPENGYGNDLDFTQSPISF